LEKIEENFEVENSVFGNAEPTYAEPAYDEPMYMC
jgi:hypothetical protein